MKHLLLTFLLAGLFGPAADSSETANRAAAWPEVMRDLHQRYDTWAAQAVPPKAQPKAKDFRDPCVWRQAD